MLSQRTQDMPEFKLQETDIRSITRGSKECLTVAYIKPVSWNPSERVKWLVCGQSRVRKMNGERWLFEAYLPAGVTDFEHDSAYAFKIPLIGVTFTGVDYGQTTLEAWVDPNEEAGDYKVPLPGYNPLKHPESYICKDKGCEKKHIIVPEGYYAGPNASPEMVRYLRGKRIEITVSPVYADGEE